MMDFDRYLGTVAASEYDLHAAAYPHCAAVASRFLVIPALSATDRLLDKPKLVHVVQSTDADFGSDVVLESNSVLESDLIPYF